MIHLKKILYESIDYRFKKSPKSFTEAARLYGGNAFRLKLIGHDESNPKFSDIERVMKLSAQFGPDSKYANGKYIFVISDDLRKSQRKNFYDIAIYSIDKIPKTETGDNPIDAIQPAAKVGTSKMTTIEEFKKFVPDIAAKIAPEFIKAKNTNDIDDNEVDNKPSSEKIEDITVIKTTDTSSINQAKSDKEQLDPYVSNVVKQQDVLVAAKKEDLIKNINNINSNSNKIQIEALQHLLADFLKSEVAKHPEYNSNTFLKTTISRFLSQPDKKLYDGVLGPATRGAVYIVNALYSGYTKEQLKTFTTTQLSIVTQKTIEILFSYKSSSVATESKFSLKSIIFETHLIEQTPNFDLLPDIEQQYTTTTVKPLQPKTADKKKQEPEDDKKSDAKKETPKPSSSNKLVRMKNGYITCTKTIEQLTSDEFREKYSGSDIFGRIMPDIGTKKLLYGKNVKVRKGIDALPLSGMQSSFKNTWRGYEEIPHLVALKGTPDPVSWFYRDVKIGSVLPLTIGSIKSKVNKMGSTEKDLEIESYAWVVTSDKKGCWVPTTWIAIV